jgi:hypothetical protein
VVPATEVEGVEEILAETESAKAGDSEKPSQTTEGEEEPSLEELFSLRPEVLESAASTEEEGEEEGKDKKKGKKKSKHVEVTYDPDRDLTIATKKHKRGDGGGWDWES